jgi:hypothetical protein
MNESTPVRIFGRGQDVILANEGLQKELNLLRMKTILL